MKIRSLILCILIGLGLTSVALAQRPISSFPGGGSGGSGAPRGSGGGAEQRESAPDTFGIFIFQVDNPNEERAYADSLLDRFHQFDPTRLQADDFAHLGILGSAHHPLVYTGRDRGGLDLGWHQYDLYYKTGRSMPYYRLERPYTDLSFVQGSEQRDNVVGAKFSRNFANGLNYNLDYRAITQEGGTSQYPNQRNQTRALTTGMWFHGKRGRYDGFLSYAGNTTNSEDNGGVIELPESGGEFTSPVNAEVLLTDGRTRHSLREFMYTQYLRFGGRTDSTGRTSRAFTLSHQLDYDRNTFRFADTYTVSDTSFYNRFPSLELDLRGARYFLQQRTLENSFRISTYRLTGDNTTRERQQSDLIEVGITHRWHQLDFEPTSEQINNLLLTGTIGLRPGKRLRLLADGALALFDQAGDYRVKATLDVDLGKAGILRLNLRNQLYAPTYLQTRFYLTQQELYTTNFNKTLENQLGASYRIGKIGLELGVQSHLLNNYIFFDSTALPIQAPEVVGILQLTAQKDFTVGAFQLLNRVVIQQTEGVYLRLPRLFAKHSLVYRGKWFKRVLNVQIGVDARYTSTYRPDYYNPFLGQFQRQDRQEVSLFPSVDAYFSMRVTRFRAFVKMENLNTFWEPDERFFTTAFYPWPSAALRFGVSWRMLD